MSYPIVTCPCCWYITLFEANHVYEICDVCGWEDDPVQFDFPDAKSWANNQSLREKQNSLPLIGVHANEIYYWYLKDKNWKPLSKISPFTDGWIKDGIDYFNAT